MTPQLKALAEKMAEEYANNIQVGYGHGIANHAYLAGFEARDGMAIEEHAKMYQILKNIFLGSDVPYSEIKSLIIKIES